MPTEAVGRSCKKRMSVYSNILTDVSSLTTAAAAGWTLVTRNELILLPEDLANLPVIIIKPSEKFSEKQAFENQMERDYKVGLAFCSSGNQKFETGITPVLDVIDSVPKALNVTSLPTATTVWDSDVDYSPTFDDSAIPSNINRTMIEVTYRSQETRT